MVQVSTNTTSVAAYLAREPRITVLGVDYLHVRLEGGSDLYITEYGLPLVRCLLPENYWTDQVWFSQHSVKLPGTSMPYRIRTKEVDGLSKDIVLKWNRMGQDIPGETEATDRGVAEFNSPFEEICLVTELRQTRVKNGGRFCTQKPLAIYVPREYVETELLGRRQYRMAAMQRSHRDISLDPNRQYAVLYEWIKGIDAATALREGLTDNSAVAALMVHSNEELARRGLVVRDSKPHHIIVRPAEAGGLKTDRHGSPLYALVDFELLARTPQHEQEVRASKRQNYLVKQARRFETKANFPPGLAPARVMDVDYVFGRVESTGGALWVVGNDPVLFDYFLPERWRKTPRKQLSLLSPVYETVTKDGIHLVWRVSRVGELPEFDPFLPAEKRILHHGYNSPFEEMSLCLHLSRHGVETTYPRAIYMSGHRPPTRGPLDDIGRYDSHEHLTTPDGHPILSSNHSYITVWGYWNAPDELLASKDEEYYRAIDALHAFRDGLISEKLYVRTVQIARKRLAEAGVEDLNLRGNHLLLSLERSGHLLMGPRNVPAFRICNFETLRRLEEQNAAGLTP